MKRYMSDSGRKETASYKSLASEFGTLISSLGIQQGNNRKSLFNFDQNIFSSTELRVPYTES